MSYNALMWWSIGIGVVALLFIAWAFGWKACLAVWLYHFAVNIERHADKVREQKYGRR